MLKAFPSKAMGALAMLSSMLILLALPWLDALITGTSGLFNSPFFKVGYSSIFNVFVANVILLGWLGSLAVTDVNQIWMQVGTAFYFAFFLIILPFFSWKEWVVTKKVIDSIAASGEALKGLDETEENQH
jgi:ubiquinol-cytochrome c reductase cytochrome b subunit